MLKISDFETIFCIVSLVGALIIITPTLGFVFPSRLGERFSEVYVLGPNDIAKDLPRNVKANEPYSIFLGVDNHVGSLAYYTLSVKFRNQSDPLPELLPNSTTPSPLPALCEYHVFLSDSESWVQSLIFSFNGFSLPGNRCSVERLTINGLDFQVNKVALWDPEQQGFFYQLFFELWIYNPDSQAFTFHNRFVGIWLNVTV